MITIQVNEYYGNPSYYSVMPKDIFDELERAFLGGETSAQVDEESFRKMESDYKTKMARVL